MGVSTGGHRRAAYFGADTQVALSPCLTQLNMLMVDIAHLTDGGKALYMNLPYLT
jgi:hypothetical protein